MPGSYGALGMGQAYQNGVAGGLRYGFMTQDAFDPIAAAPMRAVGPRPIPVVAGGVMLDSTSGDLGTGGMYGGSPWSLKSSMLPYLLIGLVAGVLWLHYVHFS